MTSAPIPDAPPEDAGDSEPHAPPPRSPLPAMTRTIVALTLVSAIVAGWFFDDRAAWGVVCGAVIGWGNLWFSARTLARLVSQPHAHRPSGSRGFALPMALLLKWPLLVVALGLVILYTPVRPEGVALGVVLSLIGASLTARAQVRSQ